MRRGSRRRCEGHTLWAASFDSTGGRWGGGGGFRCGHHRRRRVRTGLRRDGPGRCRPGYRSVRTWSATGAVRSGAVGVVRAPWHDDAMPTIGRASSPSPAPPGALGPRRGRRLRCGRRAARPGRDGPAVAWRAWPRTSVWPTTAGRRASATCGRDGARARPSARSRTPRARRRRSLHLVGGYTGGAPVDGPRSARSLAMLDQHLWSTSTSTQAVDPGHGRARLGPVLALSPPRRRPSRRRSTAPYAVGKAAQEALLRTLAREVAGVGVTVNLVVVKAIDDKGVRVTDPKKAAGPTPTRSRPSSGSSPRMRPRSVTGAPRSRLNGRGPSTAA